MRVALLCCALGLGMGGAAAGCKPSGPQTDTSESDSDAACEPGSLNCICRADDACDDGLVCASGYCVGGEDTTTTDPATTFSTTPVDPDTETTVDPTTPTATTQTADCEGAAGPSDLCPDAAPYCDGAGACVTCEGLASCADAEPGLPVCDPGSGRCVECTADDPGACAGTTPVCDIADQTCVKCTDHAQCDSGACDLATGACFPEDAVLWVDRGSPCGVGTQEEPFCEISDAVSGLAPGAPTVVRVKPGAATYKTKVDVPGGAIVAILGDGGAPVLDVASDAIAVSDGARVFLIDLAITGSALMTGKGILCLQGDVDAERLDITGRKGLAVDGVGCELALRRARVYGNQGAGIRLNGGSLRLENSFVTSNGTGFSMYAGVFVNNGAEVDAVYTTIVGNNGDDTYADSLHCLNAGAVRVRNSLVFGQSQATSVDCDGVEASDSVVDANTLSGEGVKVLPKAEAAWFKDPANGDFHIKPTAPLKDAAKWRTGDPAIDFDGDPRPDQDGTPDYAGADHLP